MITVGPVDWLNHAGDFVGFDSAAQILSGTVQAHVRPTLFPFRHGTLSGKSRCYSAVLRDTSKLGIALAPLVRYFSREEYAQALVEDGAVLFRALSYFRDYEDAGVRADPYEGTLAHRPDDGLKAQLVQERQTLELPHTFEARTKEDDILVYCLSTDLSSYIAGRFQAKVAVLIKDRGTFLARIRRALALIPQAQPTQLVHGNVKYVNRNNPPGVAWALPERIALRKPDSFQWQKEYRIAFPMGDAFAVENVQLSLVPPEGNRPAKRKDHPQHIVRLGSLRSISVIQRL